ncbi:MAG: hypothetical protein A2821_00250 [Candidatus Magasanikbacteria bacterium RIFCSPHIGHO2_01_FULL_41_23]|uniref:Swiss Army Knife 2H phosphoesterase domain-containing protein n=1 Tax=Candidatus Magasanikbacteria bacterium RIFCSPLOWO2_01_FULL_40_15 TaxID=1798686 RepID=A0A1F6N3V3_9BACT|nr:MAG: hypothetical protein A2821_00250 [Candidatus Magasanikbacteria bacterium RIFCSPHIGHO2_01_FULL_41_23]OGH76576.1 MAG: hypothetical protein A3F22_04520 [Candidatus Magasanikbacteria bacterium RIFCSPHIGHO2_12_FULL_41_16]OGH78554.1 MAG: hypothetical protein A2983_02720 [Candidatus Magasanikbacteria bacterium RIFCSPLOWO2_01_FULL_40_15]
MKSIEITVNTDLTPTLETMQAKMSLPFKSRGKFHVTIIEQQEKGILSRLTDEQIEQLNRLSSQLQSGQSPVKVNGVGYIDGSQPGMVKADKDKKVCFVAIEIPEATAFRECLGLERKDFHITLGFINNDIHYKKIGERPLPDKPLSPKRLEVKTPIEKQPDPSLTSITVPTIEFGGFNEPDPEEEKPAAPKPQENKDKRVAVSYNMEIVEQVCIQKLIDAQLIVEADIPNLLKIVETNPNALGGRFGAITIEVKKILEEAKNR